MGTRDRVKLIESLRKKFRKKETHIKKEWDLDNATEARLFLKQLRVGKEGAKITCGYDAKGNEIKLDDMSDSQILGIVSQFKGLC